MRWICGLLLAALVGCAGEADKPGKEVTLPSGLKYQDLKVGDGEVAEKGEFIEVDYTGTFPDGKVFDSSIQRGKPFSFWLGAGRVIKGWDEGVQGMKVGGKRKLWVPSALGYGPEGMPDDIPPNQDLVFEVELHRVNKKKTP